MAEGEAGRETEDGIAVEEVEEREPGGWGLGREGIGFGEKG